MAYTTKEYILHVVCLCLTTVLREREVAGRAGGQVHVDDRSWERGGRAASRGEGRAVRFLGNHITYSNG
jgi:hypothetical protein